MSKISKVFIDYSGSTDCSSKYWSTVQDIIYANKNNEFYFWDTKVTSRKSFNEAWQQATSKKGFGGTTPDCFVGLLKEDDDIIIVTDGQIVQSDIEKCDGKLSGMKFSNVEMHFIGTGGNMNLSVSAPFTRKTKFNMYINGENYSSGSTEKEIDFQSYHNNVEAFISEAENINKQITLKLLGLPGNHQHRTQIRNDLLKLQENLLRQVANMNTGNFDFDSIRKTLDGGNYDGAIKELSSFIMCIDSSLGKKVETLIRGLIHTCESNDFSFDVLQHGRLARTDTVASTRPEELPSVEDYSGNFECPVSLSEEIPVCLIKQGLPVLDSVEKSKLDSIMANPLMLLLDNTLVEKVKHRLDHPIGLDSAKELFSRGSVKSPLTRKKISCALTFGLDHTHFKATNYAVANLLFGNKLVGQPELWLAVIYFIITDIPYLNDNNALMKAYETHMIHRMKTMNTNMTLSGLPIEPMIKCPVDIAIWYCVMSAYINRNNNPDDVRNRLRSMGPASKYLVKLVNLLNYPYPMEWILRQMSLYKAFAWMMNEEKSNNPDHWKKLIRAQYQNSMILSNGNIIILDGPDTDTKPKLPSFRAMYGAPDVSLEELLTLQTLVNRSRTTNSIMIPENLVGQMIPDYVRNYSYKEDDNVNRYIPELSPKTFRPYIIDRKKNIYWLNSCIQEMGSKFISAYSYFIRFVDEHDRYPSQEEFIEYLERKQLAREDGNASNTLPQYIQIYVNDVFTNYETILGKNFSEVSVSQFINVTTKSRESIIRANMDGSNYP
jgi:hypothetical protein